MLSNIWGIAMRAYVNGIGLFAPGLDRLAVCKSVLTGDESWEYKTLPKLVVSMLPSNERRRTTSLIKLALEVAKLAIDDADIETKNLASVFASSDGDLEIVHKLCEALSQSEKSVSPTQFHNSVHNAPAGYWAIAANTHMSASSVSAADSSFAVGLLESMTQVSITHTDVLLVSYDFPPPAPLDKKRDITMPFGLALLFSESPSVTTRACLDVDLTECLNVLHITSKCQNSSLESLRVANPAARGLPVLEGIYRKQSMDIVIPYVGDNNLKLHIEP